MTAYTIMTNIETPGAPAGTISGTITASQSAFANDNLTFTVTPNSGYQLVSLKVMNGSNNIQINHQQAGGIYSP